MLLQSRYTYVHVGNYQGFGKAKTQRGIVGNDSIRNPIRFQGQYEDEEIGLYYNRFRYYDPLSGQYTQQDPIGLAGGFLLDQYVDNPVGWLDPYGLNKYVVIGEGQTSVEAYAGKMRRKYPNMEFRTIKKDWQSIVTRSGAHLEERDTLEWERKAVRGNVQWIEDRHRQGYHFIDIGSDGSGNRSSFYDVEKKALSKVNATVYKGKPSVINSIRKAVPQSNRPPSKILSGASKVCK